MKIHATDLDSYLWYQRMENMTADDLRKRILRQEPPADKMLMGTAWHKILEDPPAEIDSVEQDGFTFEVECDKKVILPQITEVRASKDYPVYVQGNSTKITGKVDGITGNKVIDHKLSFKPNPETYFSSYQWRAYLDIFGADIFTYYIYHAKQGNDIITITDVSEFTVYRYPGMVSDLIGGLQDLIGFIVDHVPEAIK